MCATLLTKTPSLSASCVDTALKKVVCICVCVYPCLWVCVCVGELAPHSGALWNSAHAAWLNGLFLHLCKPRGVSGDEATPRWPLTPTSDPCWIWSGGTFWSPCACVQRQKWVNWDLSLILLFSMCCTVWRNTSSWVLFKWSIKTLQDLSTAMFFKECLFNPKLV